MIFSLAAEKKKPLKNSPPLHDKSLGENRGTSDIPKDNKGNLQQAYSQPQIKWRGTENNSTKIMNKK